MSQHRVSRRTFLSTSATLLASLEIGGLLSADDVLAGPKRDTGELALNRPVTVSSTDYAPTPAEFAVDGLDVPGVRGSGWRAQAGDPQWIAVDLQAPCTIESVELVFEAEQGDPVFVPKPGDNPRNGTTGDEILSSYAVAFRLEASLDGRTWERVHETSSGTGGVTRIALPQAVRARWLRLTSTKRSNPNPLGLNGFRVYGSCNRNRPPARGWTSWDARGERPAHLAVAGDGSVPLESGWRLTLDDWAGTSDGKALSRAGVDTAGWLPATVPGTVLASLVEQGHLPDPVAGFNNLHVPEALSRHSWWYRSQFRLPRGLDVRPGRHVWLELDGVNHQAEVWVNGTRAGDLTYPFARAAFDVTGALRRGEQAVAVKVTPMPYPGSPGDKGPDGISYKDAGSDVMMRNAPTYLAVSGWDWMPAVRDRVTGIWNHVRLRSTGDAVIGDPPVTTTLPDLPDTSTAEVTITVPVRNVSAAGRSVTVRARFGDVAVSRTVTIAGGKTADVEFAPADFPALRLRDPELWWPNGYGDPALQDLTVTASTGGSQSDRRTLRFGIRQFDYRYEVFEPGQAKAPPSPQVVEFDATQARYVRILGHQRATGYGFSLWTLSVYGSGATDLALHQPATASSSDDPGRGPEKAVDGDPGTRWSSSWQDEQWIEVDLGKAATVERVALSWEAAYAWTFSVQTSTDGSTWTTVKDVSNASDPQVVEFPARQARYVEMLGHTRATGFGFSLWTMSVSDGTGPDLALHKAATASSTDNPGNSPDKAVDGNPGTRWSSGYADEQWLRIDLGEAKTIDRVALWWETAFARTFSIRTSLDGETWTTAKDVSNAGTPLQISVNGVRVFCRGGNWGWDELLRRMPAERMDAVLDLHRDMNFTMIRNWVGSSDREEFYAGCDERGLLVWNDFWNAWFLDPPDHAAYLDIARDTIRRYRTHPCLVVWCGANEGTPSREIDDGVRQAVADEHPEVLYQSNSAGGIVSGGGPYHWIDPAQYFSAATYGTHNFGFHTEIGMPTVSVTESMEHMAGDEPAWPIGGPWYYHDWSTRGNQAPQGYKAAIDDRLGESGSLDEFCRKAQLVNYENARAMFEAWNANLWADASGLLLWMSHPAWHSTVWQTYDYDLDVNGTYYGARKGCEPVHVQASRSDWAVRIANHTTRALDGVTVRAELLDLRGRHVASAREARVDVPASSSASAFTVDWPDSLPALHLLRLSLRAGRGRALAGNVYWRYRDARDMQQLNALPPARVSVDTGRVARHGERHGVTATVRNDGASVAAMVRLSVRDRHTGDRVLPVRYDDNYLWLMPGERRRIAIDWPAPGQGRPPQPVVTAEAYNSPRRR